MEESILRKLSKIQKEIGQENEHFPLYCCGKTSRTLEDLFGWEVIEGYVMDPDTGKPIDGHCWNYNSKTGEYIDLTLHQFPEMVSMGIGPITVVEEGSELAQKIYKKIDDLYPVMRNVKRFFGLLNKMVFG